MSLTWADLFKQGTLFDLNAGVWSGQIRMKPSDLGIKDTKEVRTAINMAHARLVPKESIDSIRKPVYEARKAIEDNAIPFPLVQGAAFVPRSRRAELEEKLQELRTQFDAEANLFVVDYEKYKEDMEPVIRKAIQEAAVANPEKGIQRILAAYPPAEYIRHKFHFGWVSFAISAPIDGAVAEEMADMDKDVSNAVKLMVQNLREQAVGKINEIIDLIVRGGKYTAKTVNSARRIIARVRKLNVMGDKVLENSLKAFDDVLAGYAGSGETAGFIQVRDELQKNLDEAVEEATHRLLSLGERTLRV